MAESGQIDALVSSLSSSGVMESQDQHFSISEERALEKLRNLLNDPQQWVLKAVQAGVAAGCDGISFAIKRKYTQVSWSGLKTLETEMLRKALAQSAPLGSPFIDELVVGLRGLVGFCRLEFRADRKLVYESDRSVSQEEAPSGGDMTLIVYHPVSKGPLGLWSTGKGKVAAAQTRFLSESCLFCPVPIKLDSRLVQRNRWQSLSSRKKNEHHELSPTNLVELGLDEQWDVDGEVVQNPKFSPRTWLNVPVISSSPKSSPHCFLAWCSFELHKEEHGSGSKKQAQHVVRNLREQNSVYWLRHGVVCGVERLSRSEWCGAALGLDVSDRRSDVTGLAFSQAPLAKEQAQRLFQKLWREAFPTLNSALHQDLPLFSLPALGEEMNDRFVTSGLLAVFYTFVGGVILSMLPAFLMTYLFLPGIIMMSVLGFFLTPLHTRTKEARQAVESYNSGRNRTS